MYVTDPGSGWLGTAFPQAFFIQSEQDIERLRNIGLRSVLVDTARRQPFISPSVRSTQSRDLPAELVGLWQALPEAEALSENLMRQLNSVIFDIRTHRRPGLKALRMAVGAMVSSVRNNSNIWVYLARNRNDRDYVVRHGLSCCLYMAIYASRMKIQNDDVIELCMGALLQDMGKYSLAESILNQKGSLNNIQFDYVKQHVELSLKFVMKSGQDTELMRRVITQHHERLDGSGYPLGVPGAQIDRAGKMAAIVDVYAALTSNSVYRKAMAPDAAMRNLLEQADQKYDRRYVLRFLEAVGMFPVGAEVCLQGGQKALVIAQGERLGQPVCINLSERAGERFARLETQTIKSVLPTSDTRLDKILFAEQS